MTLVRVNEDKLNEALEAAVQVEKEQGDWRSAASIVVEILQEMLEV
jgi:hypothetical protein